MDMREEFERYMLNDAKIIVGRNDPWVAHLERQCWEMWKKIWNALRVPDQKKEQTARHLTEIELLNIVCSCGHNVVFAPVREVTPEGEIFVWHKPFTDGKAALEAAETFIKLTVGK